MKNGQNRPKDEFLTKEGMPRCNRHLLEVGSSLSLEESKCSLQKHRRKLPLKEGAVLTRVVSYRLCSPDLEPAGVVGRGVGACERTRSQLCLFDGVLLQNCSEVGGGDDPRDFLRPVVVRWPLVYPSYRRTDTYLTAPHVHDGVGNSPRMVAVLIRGSGEPCPLHQPPKD